MHGASLDVKNKKKLETRIHRNIKGHLGMEWFSATIVGTSWLEEKAPLDTPQIMLLNYGV